MNLGGHSRPVRVLILEDDRNTAESWALILHLWGHQVQTARDGPTALRAAQAEPPEVVPLDLALPKLDGYAVAKELCGLLPKKPLFIAVSGYCQESDQQRSSETGIYHHLAKPADPAHVQTLLEAFAAGSKR